MQGGVIRLDTKSLQTGDDIRVWMPERIVQAAGDQRSCRPNST